MDNLKRADRQLFIASGNQNKIREFSSLLKGRGFNISWPENEGIIYELEEDGLTFTENALIKARALHLLTGSYVVADDSGLAVEALGGKPGVHSSRFGGEKSTYPEKFKKLENMLKEKQADKMSASFICAIALILPDGSEYILEGELKGSLHFPARGEGGFGYDPIFLPIGADKTLAEISEEEKNLISHRGQALKKLLDLLEELEKKSVIDGDFQ